MITPWYPLAVSTIGDPEIHAATQVLRSRKTTMGEQVEQFEEAFARYVGVAHAVMVNSGSSADLLMAFATKTVDDEVIIPAVTWPTHVWSFVAAGYKIRFCDVDGLNTNTELVIDSMRQRTTAVSVPHLMGIPAAIDDLPVTGLSVTEDCCEALGAHPVGTQPSSWSFFFSHHMTTMEGGAVTTNDADLAAKLRSMRSHGWARGITELTPDTDPRYTFVDFGFNVRPTEVAAAIGLVQLGRLEKFNRHRDDNRRIFVNSLKGCPGIEIPEVPAGATASWFGLPFFAENRDDLAMYLEINGVETRPILGGNLLRQPAFKKFERRSFPGADKVHDKGLYVGLHPVAGSEVGKVADLIGRYMA